jgi:NitT/TauT family transport system permease protein
MVGLDVGIVLAMIGAIVGALAGAPEGLGFLILQRNLSLDMAAIFAILVLLAIMGIGLHLPIRTLHRRGVFRMAGDRDWTIGA